MYIQVSTTVEELEDAERIARVVLEKRLAGCVQFSTVRSLYHWQGQIAESHEYLCVMKTREELYPELGRLLREIHPYEVPEIIATPICDADADYLDWLEAELKEPRTA